MIAPLAEQIFAELDRQMPGVKAFIDREYGWTDSDSSTDLNEMVWAPGPSAIIDKIYRQFIAPALASDDLEALLIWLNWMAENRDRRINDFFVTELGERLGDDLTVLARILPRLRRPGLLILLDNEDMLGRSDNSRMIRAVLNTSTS